MELTGKVAIITGTSKGIGKSALKMLLDEGCKVVSWNRTLTHFKHPNHLELNCNVQYEKEIYSALDVTISKLGGVDILINNAGIGYSNTLEDTTMEEFDNMFNTNVRGLFICSKAVIPYMKKKEESHIINISSIAGTNGIETMSAYCGTKHAVRGISHSLFKEVRNDGIKVTCIYPGSVNTHFFDEIDSVTANENMMRPDDIGQSIVQALKTHPNYHIVDLEVRPLMPKGKR